MFDNIPTGIPSDGNDDEKVEILKDDAIVELKFSTGFYKRVQMILYATIDGKSSKDLKSAMKQIKDQTYEEDWVYHYETLVILCKEVEKRGKEQGQMEEITLKELREKMEKAVKDSGTDTDTPEKSV